MVRAAEFAEVGIPLNYLGRLCAEGALVRLSRGLYQRPDRVGTEAGHEWAMAAKLVPHGVISVLSALAHHGLTTQLPGSIWMTVPSKARSPNHPGFRFETVRAREPALSAGIERTVIEGVDVPIYSAAKTVTDCFKLRRRIGIDLAVEALRDALQQRKATVEDIMVYGDINRVATVMRPYLEVLSSE